MEKEFISYEQALQLKELGFDEPCMAAYVLGQFYFKGDNFVYGSKDIPNINAPIYQQAFRWFRENCGMISYVKLYAGDTYDYVIRYPDLRIEHFSHGAFKNYDDATIACLNRLIDTANRERRYIE